MWAKKIDFCDIIVKDIIEGSNRKKLFRSAKNLQQV